MLTDALLVLVLASIAIRCLPFRRVMAAAGYRGPGNASSGDHGPAIAAARRAVERWAAIVPWRTMCFEKGLAFHWLLRRRGIASFLHYGIGERRRDSLSAHVWVTVDNAVIIGAGAVARHACVMIQPTPARAGSAVR